MQFMRPGQLEAAARKFPAVYVPFGLIEWHGRHLPLGNDALKAHGILVRCAQKHGGVVYPPVYFHAGFRQEHLVPVLTDLFTRLKRTGFRVRHRGLSRRREIVPTWQRWPATIPAIVFNARRCGANRKAKTIPGNARRMDFDTVVVTGRKNRLTSEGTSHSIMADSFS